MTTHAETLPPRPTAIWIVPAVYALLTAGVLFWSLSGLEVSWERIARGGPQVAAIFRQMFQETDWSYLPKVCTGLRESLQIAALGTAIAAVLALPLGALAARNLFRLPVLPAAGKVLLNLIRTFPELILAIAFIKALGPGAFAGVLAVGLHSVGMLGKLYAERIESADPGPLEALAAGGASPLEVFRHGIVPDVLPDFLSFVLYRFDLNVRSATVLGLVGAGGVGTLLQLQRLASNWRALGTILIGIIVTVGLVDFVSAKLRARLA
jgi:phosphonate transport system permease protein